MGSIGGSLHLRGLIPFLELLTFGRLLERPHFFRSVPLLFDNRVPFLIDLLILSREDIRASSIEEYIALPG